jgi:hypothetical protein
MSNWRPAGRMRPYCFLNAACSYLLNCQNAYNCRFLYEKASEHKKLIFPNCGPLTVFQSLSFIVRPAQGFEFDMPALRGRVFENTVEKGSVWQQGRKVFLKILSF